jgi:hypothetical protein
MTSIIGLTPRGALDRRADRSEPPGVGRRARRGHTGVAEESPVAGRHDSIKDIVVGNNKGTFVHLRQKK